MPPLIIVKLFAGRAQFASLYAFHDVGVAVVIIVRFALTETRPCLDWHFGAIAIHRRT